MKSKINTIKLFITFLFLVLIDQYTKIWAGQELKSGRTIEIIPNMFELNYLDGGNTGAAWGIFSGKITMFVIFTLIVTAALIYFIMRINKLYSSNYSLNPNHLKMVQYVLTLLLSGAVGNLIDRVLNGYVIDFLYFKLIDFPVFNVADCYVTISCALLVICCVFLMDETEFNAVFTIKNSKAINIDTDNSNSKNDDKDNYE